MASRAARREVIRFLLSLPPEQREVLELAENYGFTMAFFGRDFAQG
jgi:DNA-directed RNA polymerase specialized sigma24 family protein